MRGLAVTNGERQRVEKQISRRETAFGMLAPTRSALS